MDDLSRIIGKLEAHHESDMKWKASTDERLDRFEEKLDSLWKWRWKIAGGAATVACLLTALGHVARVIAGQ